MSETGFKIMWAVNLTNGLGRMMELIPTLLKTLILLILSEHTEPAAKPGVHRDEAVVGAG